MNNNASASLDRPSRTWCLCGHKQVHHEFKSRHCIQCKCVSFEIDDMTV